MSQAPRLRGQYQDRWQLFVKGFDAGQPSSTSPPTQGGVDVRARRSTYVPALDKVAYNGGDDFLGSARERLFGFVNGQTGPDNKNAQGFVNLVKDGHASEDASASNTALIDALRNGGDLLNVFGDFPTLSDPRHADAYSPLWDAQLGLWTDKAVQQGLNTRQTDEVQVFNLAATRPDLITGINPATGQPATAQPASHQRYAAMVHRQGADRNLASGRTRSSAPLACTMGRRALGPPPHPLPPPAGNREDRRQLNVFQRDNGVRNMVTVGLCVHGGCTRKEHEVLGVPERTAAREAGAGTTVVFPRG